MPPRLPLDEAADGDQMRADAAGERRGDTGKFEVELRVADRRLGGLDRGLRAALIGGALVDVLRGAEVGPLELLRPPQLRLAQRLLGLRGLELRHRLLEPDLDTAADR